MTSISRRLLLTVGGTVATAPFARKLVRPAVAQELQDISMLKLVEPPKAPPAISFMDASGAAKTLADYSGKGVVLNLWATWCLPCIAELPALAEMSRKLAGDGVLVLPLSSDRGGAAIVTKYFAEHHVTDLPVLIDPRGEAARALGARGLPTTLVIDRSGKERARLEGSAAWSTDAALARIKELTA